MIFACGNRIAKSFNDDALRYPRAPAWCIQMRGVCSRIDQLNYASAYWRFVASHALEAYDYAHKVSRDVFT